MSRWWHELCSSGSFILRDIQICQEIYDSVSDWEISEVACRGHVVARSVHLDVHIYGGRARFYVVGVARHRISMLRYFCYTVVIIRDEPNQPMLL